MSRKTNKVEIVNRRASYEYHFVQEYDAGLLLTGTEIKSIRAGNANLADAWCLIENSEMWVRNMSISAYEHGTDNNHEPRRSRKLLLRKTEIGKLERKTKEKGFTIIPIRLYIGARGFAKLRIALATGKKSYDKRETIKARDDKRELERVRKIVKTREANQD
jgi:SsrA-binding protein